MHAFSLRSVMNGFATFALVVGICLPCNGIAYASPASASAGATGNPASAAAAFSSASPTAADFEAWEADGTLEERISFQESLGNDQASAQLIAQVQQRTSTPALLGTADPQNHLPEDHRSYMGISTTGSAHVVALYVSFPGEANGTIPEFAEGDTLEALQNIIGAPLSSESANSERENPNAAFAPYDSLNAYYARSSYGKLSIDGTAFAYTAQHPRSYYDNDVSALFAEALTALDETVDFAAYDGNADGYIDGTYLHFAGENTGWGSTWWSNEKFYDGDEIIVDGKKIGGTITLHLPSNSEEGVRTAIHETGHLLGLPDYYSYHPNGVKSDPSDRTGILTFDMMNNNIGDHNAFSKWLLGWIDEEDITRIVVNENGGLVKCGNNAVETLEPDAAGKVGAEAAIGLLATDSIGECGGFIAVSNNEEILEPGGLLSSFYLLEYNGSAGNQVVSYYHNWQDTSPLPSGFRLFRIQADLDEEGLAFARSNKTNDVHNQLIELVDHDAANWHYQFSGAADSAVTEEYGCMMTEGDAATPEGYPSTNFRENINMGFTGISIEVTESVSNQGAVEISYSNELKPNLSPSSLVLSASEGRETLSTDAVELMGSIPLVKASQLEQPYVVVDDTCSNATTILDGSTVTLSYSMPPELFAPGKTCEVVFPTGYFLIGIEDGEEVYSNEIRVTLPIGNVVQFAAEGYYENALSDTYTMADTFTCEDGGVHFIVKRGSGLNLCTVDPADPTSVTVRAIIGLENCSSYSFEALPSGGDEFYLMSTGYSNGSPYCVAYLISAGSSEVKSQVNLPSTGYTALGAANGSLFTAALAFDNVTEQRLLTIKSYTPNAEGATETKTWTVTGARSVINVSKPRGLIAVSGKSPSTGSQTACLIDLARLPDAAELISLWTLPAAAKLDLSSYSGLAALTVTDEGYLGVGYNEPEAVGSPDPESDLSEGAFGDTVFAWKGESSRKGNLVAFDEQGAQTESRCFITYGNDGVAFDKINVSATDSIAVEMTLDPDRGESRLVMIFKDGIGGEATMLSNDSTGSGAWLQTGAWLETSWDHLHTKLFPESKPQNGYTMPTDKVRFLVTEAFSPESKDGGGAGGGEEGEGGDDPETGEGEKPTDPENPEGDKPEGNVEPEPGAGTNPPVLPESGDEAPVAFWLLSMLTAAGLLALCTCKLKQVKRKK